MKCCICNCELDGPYYGNNPDGAVWKDTEGNIVELTFGPDDRCCDRCNSMYVIPGRMYRMNKRRIGE